MNQLILLLGELFGDGRGTVAIFAAGGIFLFYKIAISIISSLEKDDKKKKIVYGMLILLITMIYSYNSVDTKMNTDENSEMVQTQTQLEEDQKTELKEISKKYNIDYEELEDEASAAVEKNKQGFDTLKSWFGF